MAARECWDDGVDEGERVWGGSRICFLYRIGEAGLYVVRADGVGVGHVCGVRGGWRGGWEQAGCDERCRAACGEHERSGLGGLGMVKHGPQSERWWERVRECDDTWGQDGSGGALGVREAGAEHDGGDGLGIRHVGSVPCGVEAAGRERACVDERREACGKPVSSDIGGSWGAQCGGWQRDLDRDEDGECAWSEHRGEGVERVCEVWADGMRADRVGIGHIGTMPGGGNGWRERAGDAERWATGGERICCGICGQGVDERRADGQRCWDRSWQHHCGGCRTGAMAG